MKALLKFHKEELPGGQLSIEAVEVILSRRNLLAMLSKLEDTPWSARTLISNDVIAMMPDGHELHIPAAKFVFRGETDDEHYALRPHAPGEMHPDTEQGITKREE